MQLLEDMLLPHCWVCSRRFSTSVPPGPAQEQDHHLYPQAYGGEDGPKVSLCSDHHSCLHRVAEAIMASKPYQHLVAAEPPEHQKKLLWMASLVVAAERASAGDPNKRSLLVMKLSGAEALALDLLKARLSLSSRQAVVRNCLAYRLKSIR